MDAAPFWPEGKTPMPETVLVTAKEYAKGAAVFDEAQAFKVLAVDAEEEALADAVRSSGARAVIVGVERYSDALYRALEESAGGRESLIARFGVGHDSVDKALARRRGIVVCNTPGVLDISVAEHAIWLMGTLARNVALLDRGFREGEFTASAGIELHGRRLGILGFGRIGRRVAAMAHAGFGMRVLAADTLGVAQLEEQECQCFDELSARYGLESYGANAEDVLRECDVLSVHLAAVADTRHFVNAQRLALMKPSALLVNTARGMVLDEEALYDALSQGRLAGAALDVFETEPYQPRVPAKDLRTLPNTVLTPHIGSNTLEANNRMAVASLSNVEHFFAGRLELISRVDG